MHKEIIHCQIPNCPNDANHCIDCLGDRYFYCNSCRTSFDTYTWKYFKPLESLERSVNGIDFNLRVVFNGKPILCQLVCDCCKTQYCGAWRNDWLLVICRECKKGKAKPIIDYKLFEIGITKIPEKERLN